MSRGGVAIKFTGNFEANLATIEAFGSGTDFPQNDDRLLDELGDPAIPTLERFPTLGWPFLARRPESVEAVSKQESCEPPWPASGKAATSASL